jgi:hypothetical protein
VNPLQKEIARLEKELAARIKDLAVMEVHSKWQKWALGMLGLLACGANATVIKEFILKVVLL